MAIVWSEDRVRTRTRVATLDLRVNGVRRRVAVEAAHPMPWYRWVGDQGDVIGLTRFGASAPYERIYRELGLTPEAVVARIERLLGK